MAATLNEAIGKTHKVVLFKAYCPEGLPQLGENFEVVERQVEAPKAGEVLFEVMALSVDPYMRARMKNIKSYAPGFSLGESPQGAGVLRVVQAGEGADERFASGKLFAGFTSWSEYVLMGKDALAGLSALPTDETTLSPLNFLSGLGMPSMTAYFGLLRVCAPKEGETVLVTGAAGAVGSMVGQIARLHGCRVIGTAGTDEKCDFLRTECGFDVAINYKTTEDMSAAIAAAAPNGIDCFFDNVGGPIADAVWTHLNLFARVAQCGAIAGYNAATPSMRPDRDWIVITKRIKLQGILVTDWQEEKGEFLGAMSKWIAAGKIRIRETHRHGLENIIDAFNDMMNGENIGKMIVVVKE